MAVTNQASVQAAIQANPSTGRLQPADMGDVRLAYFSHTQAGAGDATSTVDLIRLPAGRVRVIGHLSRVNTSAFGASRTLAIGHAAAFAVGGAAIDADDDAFAAATSVASEGGFAGAGFSLIETESGIPVIATVAGGTIPDGATVEGVIAYMVG